MASRRFIMSAQSVIAKILADNKSILLKEWMELQMASSTRRADLISEQDLKRQSEEFLYSLRKGLNEGDITDLEHPAWEDTLRFLAALSRSGAERGFSPSETATFVFSLKEPLFRHLKSDLHGEADEFMEAAWALTEWLDKLGLYTTEVYSTSRQEIIARQQEELLELSTPVVKLWDGVLALPLIGILDSARTQSVMENLLQQIVATESRVAIIDITGVPTVDTLVAQHLLKTVAAARLMGAECVISGIRPQIAQTMVHLGVGFNDVTTKATMAEALRHAFKLYGYVVTKSAPRS
jgi:rsbT co-antagonist protein RsbR